MSTGSPQSIPIKSHSFLKAKHFKAVLPHRPHKSSTHFLCGWGNNTSSQPHPLQTIGNFRPAVRSPQPAYSASLTDMASSLTTWHAPKATYRGSKGHAASGTHPPIAAARSYAPMSKRCLQPSSTLLKPEGQIHLLACCLRHPPGTRYTTLHLIYSCTNKRVLWVRACAKI